MCSELTATGIVILIGKMTSKYQRLTIQFPLVTPSQVGDVVLNDRSLYAKHEQPFRSYTYANRLTKVAPSPILETQEGSWECQTI